MTKSSAVPEILSKAEAAELIGVSPRTLEDWRLRGAALFAGDNLARRALTGTKLGGYVRYSRRLILELLERGDLEAAA